MESRRSFLSDAVSVSTANILSTLMQIGCGVLIARLLGPEGNGLYTYLLVVPTLVGVVTRLGVKRSTVFFISKKTFSYEDVISSLIFIAVTTSLLGALITGGIFYFSDRNDITFTLSLFAILSIPLNVLINYSTGIFLAEGSIRKYNVLQWIPNFINLLLLIVFLFLLRWSVPGALLAYLSANLIMAFYAVRLVAENHPVRFQFNYHIIRNLLGLGLSFTIAGMLIKLHYRFDIVMLRHLSDLKEVGFYSLATRITERWQGPLTVGVVIYSRTALAEDINIFKDRVLGWIKISFLLGIMALVVLYFIVPYLIVFLYGQKFIPSIEMVQWILPGILMLIVSKTLISFFLGVGKAWSLVYIIFFSLIINISLNFIFIPKLGGKGAALTTDISYFVMGILMFILFTIRYKIPLKQIISLNQAEISMMKRFILRKKDRAGRKLREEQEMPNISEF